MLFDVLGSLFSFNALLSDQLSRLISIATPGSILGSIPVWDQYMTLMKWLLNHLADIFGSAGVAIIVFTVIIKTILLPITVKSIRSSKNMQELAPKIKEIQKKYGKDRQKASAETMALYQTHGVNPMAGCLPMVLQIPIFFGLYYSIRSLSGSHIGLWDQGFLWLPNLHDPDPFKILPILAGIFQFVQARMMRPANQKATDQQQQIMNTMMNFMPLMVVVFGWKFSSGPVIYWVTQAIYSVVQQWLITGWGSFGTWFPFLPELPDHRRLGYQVPRKVEDVVVVSGEAGAGAPQGKGISAWINRKMMEAQSAAQEQKEEAANKSKTGAGASGKSAKPARAASTSSKGAKNGKVTAASDGDVIDVEGDDVVSSRSKQRSANYHARTAGSKFGAARDTSKNGTAVNTGADDSVVVTGTDEVTPAAPSKPAKTAKTGNPRTKPKHRPTG